MINRLHIRNFAIIDELDLILKPGLTVITGETGSGKSIILQALNVSLGMKPTKTMIKTGQAQAIVETSYKMSCTITNETAGASASFEFWVYISSVFHPDANDAQRDTTHTYDQLFLHLFSCMSLSYLTFMIDLLG